MKKTENRILKNNTIISLIINIVIFISILYLSFISNSFVLINTTIESGLDIIVSIVIIIVSFISSKKADNDHPYGHQRIESLVVVILGVLLVSTSLSLVYEGFKNIYLYLKDNTIIHNSNQYALIGISIKISLKLLIFIITFISIYRVKSISIKAILLDSISDIYVLCIAVISIILSQYNLHIFEIIAEILVAGFILYNGISLIKNSFIQVVDKSINDTRINNIRDTILKTQGVIKIDQIKTRIFGYKFYVDIEITVDKNLSVKHGHDICENVEKNILNSNTDILGCIIHVNPSE